ncbi:MAG: DUF4392 domain-containing protein [Gemmataceae bacterium]|nr:DUF4392 domain-containing protein [Gemmataceae bacterium]
MSAALTAMRDLIQQDVGNRGLRTDPRANLLTACSDDFAHACRSIAETEQPALAVVTGFYIPHAQPPCGETDGPLGAVFLARALVPLGVRVALVTDGFCRRALEVGLAQCGLTSEVPVWTLPLSDGDPPLGAGLQTSPQRGAPFPLTHLIALERAGPSHTPASLQAQLGHVPPEFLHEVPPEHHDRCHTMRGLDITARMNPAHLLFEAVHERVVTIGIGDGGNEIGMGKMSWEVIRRNIPGGGVVACRVPTDHLIVCGVSNWGAYGLAAGVRLLRGAPPAPELFDMDFERGLLQAMVEGGPLVDGVTGEPTATVDGLSFERYAEPLQRLANMR